MSNISRYVPHDSVVTVEKAMEMLQKEMPEFWSVSVFAGERKPYLLFEEFGQWLGKSFQERTATRFAQTGRAFDLVNRLLEHGSDEVVNIVMTSFIEAIDIYLDDSIDVARLLGPTGIAYLERWRKFLGGKL